MSKTEETGNTFRDDKAASIIKVGDTFFDIKLCFAFSFENNPDGFLFMKARSAYDSAKAILIPIPDSNELHRVFLQLENFLNPQLTNSLRGLVDEIIAVKKKLDKQEKQNSGQPEKKTRKKKE